MSRNLKFVSLSRTVEFQGDFSLFDVLQLLESATGFDDIIIKSDLNF